MPILLDTVKRLFKEGGMSDEPSLREVLIASGLALLEEGGMAGLTLRKCAARAGVSHAAPAHHFAGLPGLLTAMAGRAFALFSHAMETDIAAAPDTPRARLLATCTGYLRFAADHAGLFHLMFLSPAVNRADPEVLPHSTRAYQILREACLPFSSTGEPDVPLEIAVWSMVHGYATLGFQGPVDSNRPIPATPGFAALLDQLLAGREPR